MKLFWQASLSLLLLTSCASNQETSAPVRVEESFTIKPATQLERSGEALAPTDKAHLVIQKSALGKEFLFQGSMMVQYVIPSFEGLKSRIVLFERKADQVVMLESPRGHQATETFPQQFLLASFEILEETETGLTIDFNKGMSKLLISYDWYASDVQGPVYNPEFMAIQTRASFIESIAYSATNKLVVDQLLDIMLDVGGMSFSVRAKYYLEPYQSNPDFSPMEYEDFRHVGYFQANPILENGGKSKVFASKRDLSKPVVYAISANTPEDYKQAVKEGILYWNQALGENRIEVIEAPKGISAPHPDYNIVQWVEWDDAGFAYADAQLDPLTGEILHSQVFMTSAFAVGSKAEAEDRMIKMFAKDPKAVSRMWKPARMVEYQDRALKRDRQKISRQKRLSLKNFYQDVSCQRDMSDMLSQKIGLWLRSGADDAAILKASQDYVREVIAHEVGHTLGLRHNFAGTASSELNIAARDAHVHAYLKGVEAPATLNVSSSVMDYHVFGDAALIGARIRQGGDALSYDRIAIQHLHGLSGSDLSETPYFCTDSDLMLAAIVGPTMGCDVFDSSANTLEDFASAGQTIGEDLPYYLAWIFGAVKGLGYDVRKAPFFPSEEADYVTIGSLVNWYFVSERARHIQHRYDFPFVSEMNIEEYLGALESKMLERLKSAGGFEKLLSDFSHIENLTERFVAIAKGAKRSGKTPFGSYEFTDAEIAQMERIVRSFESKFAPAVVNSETLVAGLFAPDVPAAFTSEAMKGLDNRAKHFLLSTNGIAYSGEVTVGGIWTGRRLKLSLPAFKYSTADRVVAAGNLFKASNLWVKNLKAEYKNKYESLKLAAFNGTSPSEIPAEKMPAEAQAWLNELNAVIAKLQ